MGVVFVMWRIEHVGLCTCLTCHTHIQLYIFLFLCYCYSTVNSMSIFHTQSIGVNYQHRWIYATRLCINILACPILDVAIIPSI